MSLESRKSMDVITYNVDFSDRNQSAGPIVC